MAMLTNGMRPVHPGEVLKEDYLEPLGMSVNALAKRLRVPVSRVNDIVRGRRGVTADSALRLARCFGGDPQSWLNLQMIYDLRKAEIASAKTIRAEIEPLREAA
jgi:antitoxin HigA-1